MISVCRFWLHVVVPLSNTLNPEQTQGFYRARSVLTVVWSPFGFGWLIEKETNQTEMKWKDFFFNSPLGLMRQMKTKSWQQASGFKEQRGNMRWGQIKCAQHTWTGEWWMDPPTSCRRAASIDPSTTTENHQSHRRVGGKAPALSPVVSTREKEGKKKKQNQNHHRRNKATFKSFSQDELFAPLFFFPIRQTVFASSFSLLFPATFPGRPTAAF